MKSTSQYFLRCDFFDNLWVNNWKNIYSDVPTIRDKNFTNILLHCDKICGDNEPNQMILITQQEKLNSGKDLINLFFIRPKLLVISYIFDVSHLNTNTILRCFFY